jgi:hypothetical protein
MKSILLGILVLNTGFAGEYPSQKINPRDSVHFGQAQGEVEHRLRKKAAPENSGIGRPGKDFVLTGRASSWISTAAFSMALPLVTISISICQLSPSLNLG